MCKGWGGGELGRGGGSNREWAVRGLERAFNPNTVHALTLLPKICASYILTLLNFLVPHTIANFS